MLKYMAWLVRKENIGVKIGVANIIGHLYLTPLRTCKVDNLVPSQTYMKMLGSIPYSFGVNHKLLVIIKVHCQTSKSCPLPLPHFNVESGFNRPLFLTK